MNSVTASANLTVGAGGSCSAPKNRQRLTSFCEGRVGVSSQRFYASCGFKGAHRYIGKQRLHAILPFSVYSPKPSVLRRFAMRDGENIPEKIVVISICYTATMVRHGAPRLERAKGIEPSYAAWEAAVLPLNYARKILI